MPSTTITKSEWTNEDGNERVQFRTTVPKGLVEAIGLEGEEVEWDVDSGTALTIRKK